MTFVVKYVYNPFYLFVCVLMENMESKEFPRVSVITPVYNRQKTIRPALLSAMQQEYPDVEFVVVNDGSQDDTQKVVESMKEHDPRIILVNNPKNLWISQSRNIGMQHATGDIFAVLDSDDVWIRPDKLIKQVKRLQENPNIGIIWTNAIIKNKEKYSHTHEHLTDRDIRWNSIRATQFLHSSMMYPRKVYETIGGYNPQIKYADDREFQLRAGKYFEFANLPEYMVLYNAHQKNVSHLHRKRQCLESMRLSLRYSWDYPNVVSWISYKLMGGAYKFASKSLDALIPWTSIHIKSTVKLMLGKKDSPLELSEINKYLNRELIE